METVVVVTREEDWPLDLPGVKVMTALEYLAGPEAPGIRHARVFNLCRHYRYQALGYFVSLLAEARGHRPVPTVQTIQDLGFPALMRMASDDLEDLAGKVLQNRTDPVITFNVYFGTTADRSLERLGTALFRHFTVPYLQATFKRNAHWQLTSVNAIPASAIPDAERDASQQASQAFFTRRNRPLKISRPSRFDLAIVFDPADPTAPSDPKAIQKFVDAAADLDIDAEVITKEDSGRLLEFDGLFIRATTSVDHYTYRLARRAQAEGLVVIDDPLSILRCTNKVFLAEILARRGVATPRTLIVHRGETARVVDDLGLPCVVKQPDSSSSLGVFKADTPEQAEGLLERLFLNSDLLIAQEFLPTEFDWRIGVLDRQPLFAARYFMAPKHWQIIRHDAPTDRKRYGRWETVPVQSVPSAGLATAVAAANLIGDGLYGVDLKQVGDRWLVIEVNDNPNIETGVEDDVLKDDLYRMVMRSFVHRLEAMTEARSPR